MKFGLRIHWGEYAIDAIGPESWPLNGLSRCPALRVCVCVCLSLRL